MRSTAVVLVLVSACTLSSGKSVPDPSRPGEQVEVKKEIGELCGLICDALIASYGVPSDQKAGCEAGCASGFAKEPDACYELVSCVADRTLCEAGGFSQGCAARAGACLSVWGLGNGICRSCWSPNRAVSGVRRRIYRSDGPGEVVVPEDLSRAKVRAYLPVPSGRWPEFAGSGDAQGNLRIPEVPGCGYFLEVENVGQQASYSYEFRDATASLDQDEVWLGREGWSVTTSTRTRIRPVVDGLVPWTRETAIEVFVPNVQGWWARGILFDIGEPWSEVPDGATRLDRSGIEWPRFTGLPEASKGDRAYLLQFTPVPAGSPGFGALAVQKVLITEPVTFVDSATTTIMGTFTDQGLATGSFQASVRFSEFARFAQGSIPTLSPPSAGLGVHSVPTDRYDIGYQGPSPDFLWIYTSDPEAGVPDLVMPSPIEFRDPMPSTWTRQLDVSYRTTARYVVVPGPPHTRRMGEPRPEQGAFAFQQIAVDLRLQDLRPGEPIVPLVSPVRNLRIGGRPGQEDLTGVGLTPEIGWEAPEIGTPTSYRVMVFELRVGLDKRLAGNFTLPGTSLRVPPGALESGRYYVLSVTARRDVAAQTGSAQIASGVFTP